MYLRNLNSDIRLGWTSPKVHRTPYGGVLMTDRRVESVNPARRRRDAVNPVISKWILLLALIACSCFCHKASCGVHLEARAKDRRLQGPLRVLKDNPRYFTDDSGRAVYLTGSHTWSNLVDIGPEDPPPRFDFIAYLDWMQQLNHNFIRMWTWEPVTWNTKANNEDKLHISAPQPWARTGPGMALDGKPKFNLKKFNPAYFDRLRRRVSAACDRGVCVSIMLFEGWAMQFSTGAWEGHPFHQQNNVNRYKENSFLVCGCATRYGCAQPLDETSGATVRRNEWCNR